jgi:predicted transcriptional regulator
MNTADKIVNRRTVGDCMSREVLGVKADWSVEQLCDFFVDKNISGAPVMSQTGGLVGVVSVTDIIRYESMHMHESHPETPHDYYLQGLESRYAREEIASLRIESDNMATVQDIMTPMIFQVDEGTTVQAAADIMIKGHIHRIFVTRDKRVVGVLTAFDMLKVIRDS